MMLGALFAPISALAQVATAPRLPYPDYAGWVNARKPASVSGDNWQTIPTGRDPSLPAHYDVFWRAVLATETYGGKHFDDKNNPIRGMGDSARYGNKIISIGISQARYDDGTPPRAYTSAQQFNPYIRGQAWNLGRYLWDPAYNAAIGFGRYGEAMRDARNNPCLGYAHYNGGPRGMRRYIDAKYRPVDSTTTMITKNVSKFVINAKKFAGPHAAEINKILETSPGCNVGMDDVEPLPPMAAPPPGGSVAEVHVLGYCDPKAIDMLTNHYRAQQRDMDDSLEPLYRAVKRPYASSDGSGGGSGRGGSDGGGYSDSITNVSSCVSLNWPNLSFQRPTLDQIIKAAETQIIRAACERARSSVADARSTLNQRFYFNPRIPGVPSSGVSISTDGSP